MASAEDAVLDLLPAVAQNPRSGSQLWYDLMGVLKLQGATLDMGYIERVAVQAGLAAAWRELLGQRDTVGLGLPALGRAALVGTLSRLEPDRAVR
ncbi:MAG TPA: hypothetical protein VFU22_10015 [Roseiflexaceae bacterium]|nr:hypothetical protein [Roseiflexaceae bacterium]